MIKAYENKAMVGREWVGADGRRYRTIHGELHVRQNKQWVLVPDPPKMKHKGQTQ
jgi:hypothetical protein